MSLVISVRRGERFSVGDEVFSLLDGDANGVCVESASTGAVFTVRGEETVPLGAGVFLGVAPPKGGLPKLKIEAPRHLRVLRLDRGVPRECN